MVCANCGAHLCDVEHGDALYVLINVANAHDCDDTAINGALTRVRETAAALAQAEGQMEVDALAAREAGAAWGAIAEAAGISKGAALYRWSPNVTHRRRTTNEEDT
jgi:hypothetical protein